MTVVVGCLTWWTWTLCPFAGLSKIHKSPVKIGHVIVTVSATLIETDPFCYVSYSIEVWWFSFNKELILSSPGIPRLCRNAYVLKMYEWKVFRAMLPSVFENVRPNELTYLKYHSKLRTTCNFHQTRGTIIDTKACHQLEPVNWLWVHFD